jgi:hypothetical protein
MIWQPGSLYRAAPSIPTTTPCVEIRKGMEKRGQAIRTIPPTCMQRSWNARIFDTHVGFGNSRMALGRSGSG